MISTELSNRYVLSARLGQGGMGTVYRALDTRCNREVAIKVLNAQMDISGSALPRFRREGELLSALKSPRIVQLLDQDVHEQTPYLVFELVSGTCLEDRIKERTLTVTEALELGRDVCEALEIAHGQEVVHRDLKPANIFLTATGARLLDFGIAKVICTTTHEKLTTEGSLLGTPQFMAPEYFRTGEVSPSMDLWALGVVLFQCLTGELPFQGETLPDVVSRVLEDPAPRAHIVTETVPLSVSDLIDRCLRKNPVQRFASATELKAWIETVEAALLAESPGTERTREVGRVPEEPRPAAPEGPEPGNRATGRTRAVSGGTVQDTDPAGARAPAPRDRSLQPVAGARRPARVAVVLALALLGILGVVSRWMPAPPVELVKSQSPAPGGESPGTTVGDRFRTRMLRVTGGLREDKLLDGLARSETPEKLGAALREQVLRGGIEADWKGALGELAGLGSRPGLPAADWLALMRSLSTFQALQMLRIEFTGASEFRDDVNRCLQPLGHIDQLPATEGRPTYIHTEGSLKLVEGTKVIHVPDPPAPDVPPVLLIETAHHGSAWVIEAAVNEKYFAFFPGGLRWSLGSWTSTSGITDRWTRSAGAFEKPKKDWHTYGHRIPRTVLSRGPRNEIRFRAIRLKGVRPADLNEPIIWHYYLIQ